MGCYGRVEGVAGNCGGGWYLPPLDPENSSRGKEGRDRVHTITEDLVDIFLISLEGGTEIHEGEGGYHTPQLIKLRGREGSTRVILASRWGA